MTKLCLGVNFGTSFFRVRALILLAPSTIYPLHRFQCVVWMATFTLTMVMMVAYIQYMRFTFHEHKFMCTAACVCQNLETEKQTFMYRYYKKVFYTTSAS